MDAAKKGYIAYTCCTAALAEVVPFMGKVRTDFPSYFPLLLSVSA